MSARLPCWECGAPSDHDHHVVPRSMGGTRTVPLCGACHGKAHGNEGLASTRTLVRAAMAHKRVKGEKLGGDCPYGMRLAADGVHLETDPAEARVLDLIRSLRSEGLSLVRIAERLNDAGTPARGSRWHPTTVARLLDRVAA